MRDGCDRDVRDRCRAVGRQAFTLTEILIVIVIVLILAGLSFVGVQRVLNNARRLDAESLIRQVADSLHAYQEDGGFDRDGDAARVQAEPLRWLILAPQQRGRPAYLDLPAKNRGAADGTRTAEVQPDGTIIDVFSAPLTITLVQHPKVPVPGQRCTLGSGLVATAAGTPAIEDDIAWRYDAATADGLATWTRIGR